MTSPCATRDWRGRGTRGRTPDRRIERGPAHGRGARSAGAARRHDRRARTPRPVHHRRVGGHLVEAAPCAARTDDRERRRARPDRVGEARRRPAHGREGEPMGEARFHPARRGRRHGRRKPARAHPRARVRPRPDRPALGDLSLVRRPRAQRRVVARVDRRRDGARRLPRHRDVLGSGARALSQPRPPARYATEPAATPELTRSSV